MKVKWSCTSLIKSQLTNGIGPSLPTRLSYFLKRPSFPFRFKSSPDPERNIPEARAGTKDKHSNDKNLCLAIPVHAVSTVSTYSLHLIK